MKLLSAQPAVLVSVQAHRGSVPREAGAWMAVFADSTFGSIGGGHLEWQAMEQARAQLGGQVGLQVRRVSLGPSLGQCCGGEVTLQFEPVSASDLTRLHQHFSDQRALWPPVALFGGGHVATALVQVLGRLPFRVHWLDSRDGIFPEDLPANACAEHSDPVQRGVAGLAPGTRVLIMSFSHAEDLDVVAACLLRQRLHADLPFIGLIGSRSKWATFRHRLAERGFSAQELGQVTSPIGVPDIAGKVPDVIAVAVAAQLLQLSGSTKEA
ncbi:xanthine dehydrogenase accessory protein XdhC [Rhodoferax sp.]|uniref:xanthine dehydrogenase accessory protein XdhC n=1 Tax=Rhodoferax sp. TaxID=50421 RepID=UPI002716BEBA|nr:xanthine dehydrogenase accessory protein XdhC [Rhodoferax sp.]MDO9145008.1 xanthine dehydrogenase accessory protein XdhC [Rhodoferax sp.]MDP3864235.1 xanthine dehydrogenase accessory protein XdhC [Rhodoferax sp.]